MQKKLLKLNRGTASCTNRVPLTVRFTATAETGATSAVPRPNPKPVARHLPNSAGSYTGRPSLRSSSPRRSPNGSRGDLPGRPDAEGRDFESRGGPSAPGGRSGGPAAAGARSFQPRIPRPEVAFLDDDDDRLQRLVAAFYVRHVSKGKGFVVRSLGRSGAVSAIKFVLALRAAGAAPEEQRDVRFRLNPQDPMQSFGVPLMMLVEPTSGRIALPEDGSPLMTTFAVARTTERFRMQQGLVAALQNMKPGHFLRMEMVGAENIYRGLTALGKAREELGRLGRQGNLFIVPEIATVPLRTKESELTPSAIQPDATAGGAAAIELKSASVAADTAGNGPGGVSPGSAEVIQPTASASLQSSMEFTSEAGPVMVEVLRLYVSRVPRPEPLSAGGLGQAPGGTAAQPLVASGSGAVAPVAGEGQVVVSVAELESLRGALGRMMEQQRILAQLLEQQRAAATGATAAGPPGAGSGVQAGANTAA